MRRRGFVLIAALLVTLILVVAGMAYLGSRVSQYRGAAKGLEGAQARALARAGLEDARVKLEKDYRFPPPSAQDQTVFTYSEDVTDGATVVGHYTVSVNTTYENGPYTVIRITSVGVVGSRANPSAQATIHADLDASQVDPDRIYRFLRWEESTNL